MTQELPCPKFGMTGPAAIIGAAPAAWARVSTPRSAPSSPTTTSRSAPLSISSETAFRTVVEPAASTVGAVGRDRVELEVAEPAAARAGAARGPRR